LLVVFALPAFLYLILQIGFVQTMIAKKVAAYLSDKLHTEVSIGGFNVSMFFNIVLEDIVIKDKHQNTFLDSKTLILGINDFFLDRHVVSINNIVLDNTTLNMVKYKGEKTFNYQFISDYFSSNDTTKGGGQNWKINIGSLILNNVNFKYQDQNKIPDKKIIDFNDLELSGINTRILGLAIIEDSIYGNIRSLSLKEQSGFDLKNFSAIAKVSPAGIDLKNLHIETKGTTLSANLTFEYKDYDDFNHFVDKVKINALFKPSRIDLKDFGYFASDFSGMTDKINISGELKGKISNFKGKDFQFLYGKSTYFLGNFNISGLPDIETTYIHFNVKNFYTSQYDLQTFMLPTSSGIEHLNLPDELIRLGSVRFKGAFTGFYNDFVAYGDFYTEQGKVTTDLTLRKNRSTGQIEYNGKIASTYLNIGNILNMQDQIGTISMNADISGSGFETKSAAITMKGTIASISLRNYQYKNIKIEGDLAKQMFSGFLSINDENIKLDMNGTIDFSKDLPAFNVETNIENLRATKLHFFKLGGDSTSTFASQLKLNFTGNTIDNIQGSITAKNTSFTYKGEKYLLKDFAFSNTSATKGDKTMKLRSDYVDADISGNFMFKDLYLSSLKLIKDYLPSYSTGIKKNFDSIPEQNFTYFIKLKGTDTLSKLFIPDLSVSPNTVIKGSFNSKQSLLDLNITSALTKYKKISVKDFFVSIKTINYKINMNTGCQHLMINDSLGVDNITFNSVARNDSINYKLTWENNDDKIKNSGNLDGFLSLVQRPKAELKFTKANIVINDTVWTIDQGNDIVFDSSSIAIENLKFYTDNQQMKINGTISENPADKLYANFKDFNLADVKMLTSLSGFDIDGYLNGDVNVWNIYSAPNVVSNLSINNLYINSDKIGKATLISTWNNQDKTATIKADFIYEGNTGSNNPISISGSYFPEKKTDNFDLDINLTNFKLKLLEKYLSSFSSSLNGLASGKLKLKGTTKEPELTGDLYLAVKRFSIDYLNENYSFTDSVKVTKNAFIFNHLILNDGHNNTAILDGNISHKNFNDLTLDLNFRLNNFHCLNTNSTQNSIFYGTAYMSGLLAITGDVNNIKIDVSASTEKNTHIFIPISGESEISGNDYIHFVNKKSKVSNVEDYKTDLSGIELNFDLAVTPDADIQIIFDSKIGDIIKASGSGNLKMEITTLGDFNMYGNYAIEKGDYLFTLQNVINKKFTIQKGSSISWNGNPYEGIADITAIYPVKAPLYDLYAPTGDTSAVNKKRIDVDCMLGMKGKIFNPTITFDIDLPNSDDNTKTRVSGLINNEEAMNQQIFSLLILQRFTDPRKLNSSALNSSPGNTTFEFLSNQMSNWLSQISKKVDIGVNYRPGNDISAQQLEIALGTQFFNDRLSIDGNFGVSGSTTATGTSTTGKTSDIVGDVNIEYKLTNDGRVLLKGYNKSNTVDLLNSNAPYTQGVGIFYRREFDSFKDLFKKKKKKK